jgi:ATP/maltotriose-dependent transcriptional regulator MalT
MNSLCMPRPRVDDYLRGAVASARITVLQAPLGAGKSCAAATAFADQAHVVHMQAEPWHRGAFVAALVHAVRDERPDFGRLTLGALDAGAGPSHLGRTFARDLEHIEDPLLLIVENVHVFQGESGFGRFVEAAVRTLPNPVRILALGRSLPEFAIDQNDAYGYIRFLSGEFLAFNEQEIRALALWMRRDVDDDRIAQIQVWTEGWAAGVTLALAGAEIPARTAMGPRAAAERYLTKNLLTGLRPQTVRFLEDTAIFDTLETPLLALTATSQEVEESIADLRRTGALIADVRPGCYRVHPVLRELAEGRLKARGHLRLAHARAAQAYAHNGSMAEAMFHANAAADPNVSALLLRQHADAALATGNHAALRALASQIDSEGSHRDVRLYVEALLEKTTGSLHQREAFAKAASSAEASGNDAIYFNARARVLEFDLGRTRQSDAETIEALHRLSERLDDRAKATVAVLAGWADAIEHRFSDALSHIALLSDVSDLEVRYRCGLLRAYAQTALGDANGVERTLDSLVHALESQDRVVMQTLTLIWFARLSLVLGRTTMAADAASEALRLASKLDLRTEEAALYIALAEIATHTGSTTEAVECAEHAKGRSELAWYAIDVDRVRSFADIALARAAFLGHENTIARELALRVGNAFDTPAVQRAVALSECAVYTLFCEPNAAASAIADARLGIAHAVPLDAADAAALAASDDILAFLDAADGQPHQSSLVGCEAFSGLLAYRRGLVTLEHAGLAAGMARTGHASVEAFEMALSQITREGPRFEARLARAYVATFIKYKKRPVSAIPTLDLTEREGEILTLLVEGLANKEIAQRLVLSPRTIETHVERVLGKLEVGSRSRAIAKALRLGLVTLD